MNGRSTCSRTSALTAARASSCISPRPGCSPLAAMRYGACVNIVSRRFMIMSLGLSGLPVFQAGHCDWQRPHSVHAMKST